MRKALGRYQAQFGTPPPLPKNTGEKPRAPQEIYDDLKIPDENLSGVYANTVMVGHTPAEFGIDFITSFIPYASVAGSVSASLRRAVPQLIDTLSELARNTSVAARQVPAKGSESPGGGPTGPGGGGGGTGFGTAPGIPGFPTPLLGLKRPVISFPSICRVENLEFRGK